MRHNAIYMGVMQSISTPSEIEVCLERDDPRVLDLIYDEFGDDLLGYLMGLLCHRQDAEDCFQNLFILIARKRHLLKGKENLKAYLLVMARNEALGHFRKKKKDVDTIQAEEAIMVAKEEGEDLPTEALSRALASLPLEQREVITLKIYQGMTFDEISSMLDASINTVASRYRYGIKKMKLLMQEAP